MAITFIAKYNEREGNSCHIHCSLAERGRRQRVRRRLARCSTASSPDSSPCMRELTLFFAPHVNSYKRFVPGSFAPTAVAWGNDNRTCSMRVVGHGEALRVENRLPGADVNPYLALAAMIAAGLHGIDSELRARAAAGGQRLHLRQAARADQHVRGARPVRRQRAGARRLRPGGGGPLPEPRQGRARGARGDGHRLGAVPRASSDSDGAPAGDRGQRGGRARHLGGVARGRGERLAAHLHRAHRRGRRAAAAAADRATREPPIPARCSTWSTALVLAGGADIDPAAYGAEPDPRTTERPARARRVRARARPRGDRARPAAARRSAAGLQLLNVALGGTLEQHLADAEVHLHTPGAFADHEVRLEPGSLAARAAGAERLSVRSHHHQGIGRLGDGLVASGWAEPGGVIEAVELPDRRWALGILWHTEEEQMSAIIGAFVGRREPEHGGGVIEVVEPATAQVMAEVPRAGVEETDAAVAAAKAAYPGWRAVAPATGRRCCCGSRRGSRRASRSWRGWRRATRASRSPTPAARSGWSPSASATTPARPSATSGSRSRSRAASTSPSASRSVWSG